MTVVTQLESAYEYIRDKLTRAEIVAGTKLSRRRLAEEIGVSPALVQQALGQLESEGLVERRPQSGTYVRELSSDEYANMCDVRELIEPYAAARAATRLTPKQAAQLESCCRRFRQLAEKATQLESDADRRRIMPRLIREEQVFHGVILAAAANPLVMHLTGTLRLLAQVRANIDGEAIWRELRIADEHESILESLLARDGALARDRMLKHIRGSREPKTPSDAGAAPRTS